MSYNWISVATPQGMERLKKLADKDFQVIYRLQEGFLNYAMANSLLTWLDGLMGFDNSSLEFLDPEPRQIGNGAWMSDMSNTFDAWISLLKNGELTVREDKGEPFKIVRVGDTYDCKHFAGFDLHDVIGWMEVRGDVEFFDPDDCNPEARPTKDQLWKMAESAWGRFSNDLGDDYHDFCTAVVEAYHESFPPKQPKPQNNLK